MTIRARLWIAVSALCLVQCAPAPPRHVLLITIDTLRADRLGIYGFPRGTTPHLDRWFRDSALIESAYSTTAYTPPSIVSMLTGELPQSHGVRAFHQLAPDDLRLLPQMLPAEYQSAAVVSNAMLARESIGIGDRFDWYDDYVDEKQDGRGVYERRASRTTAAALRWLRDDRDPDRPVFLWVHYMDPHTPYTSPADWVRTYHHEGSVPIEEDRVKKMIWKRGMRDGLEFVDLYETEIRYLDRHVGHLLEAFEAILGIEGALVVLTADHGEAMMEHEKWFGHSYHVYDEITRVPFAVRGPGVAPGPRPGPASGIDVFPTILRFVGAAEADSAAGLDVRVAVPSDRVVFTESQVAPEIWKAAAGQHRKWVLQWHRGKAEPEELRRYDLERDALELEADEWIEGERGAEALLEKARSDPILRGEMEGFRAGEAVKDPKIDPRADEETLEMLRALGYVD